MDIADKRIQLRNHLAEAYNAEELAEMLVDNYSDEDLITYFKVFEEN